MKILPVGVQLFHADGQTDTHDEAQVFFRNFAKTPKNQSTRLYIFSEKIRKQLSFVETATYSRIKEYLKELTNVNRRINNICHL